MKQFIFSLLIICSCINVWANCTAVESADLARMKEYLLCQRQPVVHACVTLGGILGGRFVNKAVLENNVGEFEKTQRQFRQNLAEEMHRKSQAGLSVDSRQARAAAEKAIRDAEIALEKSASDKSLAADVKVRLKKDFMEQIAKNRAIVASVLDAEMKGQFKIHPPVLKRLGDRYVDIANKSFKELPETLRNEFMDEAEEIYGKARAQILSGKAFPSTFQKQSLAKVQARLVAGRSVDLLKRGVLWAAGGASLASQVGIFAATYSSSTGCSSLTDRYTNSRGSNCDAEVGLSEGVLAFLDLPSEQQEHWLKDRKVCAFYAQLKNKLLNQSIGKVSCSSKSARYQVYHSPYGSYESTIQFREDKSIQSIQSEFGEDGAVVYQVDAHGRDVSLKGENLKKKAKEAAEASVLAAKLFAKNIASCCQSQGSSREECLKNYNGEAPVPLVGAGDSLGTK